MISFTVYQENINLNLNLKYMFKKKEKKKHIPSNKVGQNSNQENWIYSKKTKKKFNQKKEKRSTKKVIVNRAHTQQKIRWMKYT